MPASVASRNFALLFRPVWTHVTIAKGLGCSRQLVGDWANGKRTPTTEAVAALWGLLARAPLARLSADPGAVLLDWEVYVGAATLCGRESPWGDAERAALRAACEPRWRQGKMAKVLRRSRQNVCAYANGKTTPSGRIAAQIQELAPEVRMADWFR